MPATRPVIYQLLPRLFGNTNQTRKIHGTLNENGSGKFSDLNPTALTSLADLGITHLWLTGVIEHASGTSYPDRPADPPDILKGIAGSPYAIRDYFDVCPDFADDPARRIEEFHQLVTRCHQHGLKVLIDFVPNHVARSYQSSVHPDQSFGHNDDPTKFFDPNNHFFYLNDQHPGGGPPLRLPTAEMPGCSGLFEPESTTGRVTGNNAITWSPSIHDWYETVKLNYGHDFTTGRDTSHLPGPEAAPADVPKTWRTMDEILAYWQNLGVDGFRADMAHLVPMEFWAWAIQRARTRQPGVFFMAEAYDNDPTKLTDHHVLDALILAGFDSVYDDPLYDLCLGLYDDFQDGLKWANDFDSLLFTGPRFHRSLRYAENHDEVRLANPHQWGGHGMAVGRPVTATLFGLGRGPVMLYHGQEVGEPASGPAGFSDDNARTTIFDYFAMPEFQKWVHDGRYDGALLSPEQKNLRAWYRQLLTTIGQPAFTHGETYGLNFANHTNPHFGRINDESVSGHWLYAFLRRDPNTRQAFLVAANFCPHQPLDKVRILIPSDALDWLGHPPASWTFRDHLDSAWQTTIDSTTLTTEGLPLPPFHPLTAMMLEITTA